MIYGGNLNQLVPIGYVHNTVSEWVDVIWEEIVSAVVIDERWLGGLEGLEEFSHIWVVAWLDRLPEAERGTLLKVHPERRQDLPAVGLFATRSPRRPNPIAITAVPLLERRGHVLRVKGLDLLDGTPVLDVKPYLSRGDRIGGTREAEWLEKLRQEKEGAGE